MNKYKELKKIINKTLSEIENIDESDLIVKSNSDRPWKELAFEFENKAKELVNNITKDNYNIALNNIDALLFTLKVWKRKIVNGEKKEGDKSNYDFSRFSM